MTNAPPPPTSPLFADTGEYVWERDARNLRIWFRICWISLVCAIAGLVLPESLLALFGTGLTASVVTAIGCVVYAYRVQSTLRRHGLARTDPAFIIVAGFLALLPTALIASPAVLSNAKKAAQSVAEGFASSVEG
jgi:lipopolysaccharide export LptBFGC system permease protein LptF